MGRLEHQYKGETWHMTSNSGKWGEGTSDYRSIYKLFFYGTERYKEGGEFKLGQSRNNYKDWSGYVRCVRRFAL